MNTSWFFYLGWIAAAALLGFAISFLFARLLGLQRRIYLVPYIGSVCLFFYAYIRWSRLSVTELIQQNWIWGIVGAGLLAVFLIRNIRSQPASEKATGISLGLDIFWSGIMYGSADALLLSVLPVLATWQAFILLHWTTTWPGRILVGILALIASLLVTTAYHAGYPEYRGKGLLGPVIGNTTMTIGYLLTNNPLAAVLSHIAMHVAGVVHGPASVVQLPPHYRF